MTTGFLVDFPLLGRKMLHRPLLVFGLIGALVIGKFSAAWLTSRIFHYSPNDRNLIASLSLPQMAATLASAVVASQALNAAGQPLVDSIFVNATLVIVVLSCVAGPILTRRFGTQAALDTANEMTAISSPAAK